MELSVDTILADRFRITGAPLGRGGFAITYPSWDLHKNQGVAIKELFPTWENCRCFRSPDGRTVIPDQPDEFALQRKKVYHEAELLSGIDHAGVVRVIEIFEDNNTVYLVMELLQGETLMSHCENKPLPIKEALDIFFKLADALEKIHSTGILHRDLNPRNVMLIRSIPIIIDFGLSRQNITNSETLSVTLFPGFAPLEQYNPKGARGPFVDVYSLAALLYLMLTGLTPEPSISRFDPNKRTDKLLPPQQIDKDIPSWLSDAIMKGLQLSSEKRHQSAKDFSNYILLLWSNHILLTPKEIIFSNEASNKENTDAKLAVKSRHMTTNSWLASIGFTIIFLYLMLKNYNIVVNMINNSKNSHYQNILITKSNLYYLDSIMFIFFLFLTVILFSARRKYL